MTSLFNTDKIVVVTGKDALNLDLEMKKKGLHMYLSLVLKNHYLRPHVNND